MAVKEKFELEYLLQTSPKVLNNMLFTPGGLSEWFADDVNIKNDVYTFIWDGSEEDARLVVARPNVKIRWKWLEDEEEDVDSYFEFRFDVDPMTKDVVLSITDFAEPDELEEAQALWEQQIGDLKRVLGA